MVPEGGVPSGGVVEAFYELEDGGACLCAGVVGVSVEEFCFQGGEERLDHGIVVRVSSAAHGGDVPGLVASVPERGGAISRWGWGTFRRSAVRCGYGGENAAGCAQNRGCVVGSFSEQDLSVAPERALLTSRAGGGSVSVSCLGMSVLQRLGRRRVLCP